MKCNKSYELALNMGQHVFLLVRNFRIRRHSLTLTR